MKINNIIKLITCLFALLITACDDDLQVKKISQEDEIRVRELGQKATSLFMNTLQGKLKSTISRDGMLAAISVCNYSAPNLTDSIGRSMENIIEVKRTSFRYRNPENAPDNHEIRALRYFQKSIYTTGKLPDYFIEKVSTESSTELRYYKPLVIKSICLNCHGPSEIVASDLSYQIKRLYPQDHAIGYQLDQFRGLIRVSIKE